MVRPGVEDDAGPHSEVNFIPNRLHVDRFQRGRPPLAEGSQEFVLQHGPEADDPSHMSIGAEPIPKSEMTPPLRFLPPVVHEVSDLNAPGPKVDLGRKCGCDGDGEQSARVGRKDASTDVDGVTPSTAFAGGSETAAIG